LGMQGPITQSEVRVRYAETDQMGIAHHTAYLVWCEVARTDYLRSQGIAYRDLEAAGLRLPVVHAELTYRAAARYDDVLVIRCWVSQAASRKVVFAYDISRPADQRLLATAQITLMAVDSQHAVTTLPAQVLGRLVVAGGRARR